MMETKAESAPSGVEPLGIYSDGHTVCPWGLWLTVAELSGWRSPPLLPLSAQTQTGPAQREGAEGGAVPGGVGREGIN